MDAAGRGRGTGQWARLFLPAALLVLAARWAGALADRAGLGPRNWDAGLRTAVALALPVALMPLLAGLRDRAGRPAAPRLQWEVVGREVGSEGELRRCLRASGLAGRLALTDTWFGAVFSHLRGQGARVHVFLARQSSERTAQLQAAAAAAAPAAPDLSARGRQLLRPERVDSAQPVCGCAVVVEYPAIPAGAGAAQSPRGAGGRGGGLAVLELPFAGLPSLAFAPWLPHEDAAPLAAELMRSALETLKVEGVVARLPGSYPSPLERVALRLAGCSDLEGPAAAQDNFVLELGFSTWGAFLASLRRSARADVLRKTRRFEERKGSVELMTLESLGGGAGRRGAGGGGLPPPLQADLDEGGLLYGWSDLPSEFAEVVVRRDELDMRVLEASLGGKPCGRLVVLHDRRPKCVHFRRLQLGGDAARDTYVFFNLLFGGLKFAVMAGAALVDMGPGAEGVKSRLGARPVPTLRCALTRGASAGGGAGRFGLGAFWGSRSREDILDEECSRFYRSLTAHGEKGRSQDPATKNATAPAAAAPRPSRRAARRAARAALRRRLRLARRSAAAEAAEDAALVDASDALQPAWAREAP